MVGQFLQQAMNTLVNDTLRAQVRSHLISLVDTQWGVSFAYYDYALDYIHRMASNISLGAFLLRIGILEKAYEE